MLLFQSSPYDNIVILGISMCFLVLLAIVLKYVFFGNESTDSVQPKKIVIVGKKNLKKHIVFSNRNNTNSGYRNNNLNNKNLNIIDMGDGTLLVYIEEEYPIDKKDQSELKTVETAISVSSIKNEAIEDFEPDLDFSEKEFLKDLSNNIEVETELNEIDDDFLIDFQVNISELEVEDHQTVEDGFIKE